jgi:hypothetical protein
MKVDKEIWPMTPMVTHMACPTECTDFPNCKHPAVFEVECPYCRGKASATYKHGPYNCPNCDSQFMGALTGYILKTGKAGEDEED